MNAPILIFGWGNPSRGDDAVGPLLVERIDALNFPGVECLTDFQLQVEHALDLKGRQRVLFIDASVEAATPFTVTPLIADKDASFTSHAMSPQAILHAFTQLEGCPPPPCWMLAVRGESFELGEQLSSSAELHLKAALQWVQRWLDA
ncbi:MAG: hydrogenase maturation protease [Sterolibacterium sp.]